MIVIVLVACVAFGGTLALLVAWVLGQVWPEKRDEVERCETCDTGLTAKEVHVLSTAFNDGLTAEASAAGGTGIAAYYCEAHCPGRCQRETMAA